MENVARKLRVSPQNVANRVHVQPAEPIAIGVWRANSRPWIELRIVYFDAMIELIPAVETGKQLAVGAKVKANASRHKAMSYDRMKEEEARLQQEIADLLAKAQAAAVASAVPTRLSSTQKIQRPVACQALTLQDIRS